MAIGQISDDGYWVWDGSTWIARTQQEVLLPDNDNPVQSNPVNSKTENQVSERVKEYNESRFSNFQKYTIASVLLFLLIGMIFLFSEENRNHGLEQTWYNSSDEIVFYPNGTYSTNIGISDNWEEKEGNLHLNISNEKSPWKYFIDSNYSDDYDILYLAPYDKGEGGRYQNNPSSQKCRIYFSKQTTNPPDIADLVKHTTPTWCEPYEYIDLVDVSVRHCSLNLASVEVNNSSLNFTYGGEFDFELCEYSRYIVKLSIDGAGSVGINKGQNYLYSQLYPGVVIGFQNELDIQCNGQIDVGISTLDERS